VSVDEHTIELAGSPLFYRSVSAPGVPAVYLHGIPTSSDDFVELLERGGGIAPDLIGFGRSGKGGHLVYTIEALADGVEPVLPELVKLVGHDWGALVALELAARRPERITSLVLCNPVPLLDGFEWPRLAKVWRRPVMGELTMGSINRWLLARTLRAGAAQPGIWTAERIASVWEQFDQGTQRAILRLYRRTDVHRLEAERPRLEAVTARALIVWGERDPWNHVGLAERFAELLPHATLERVADAGHWPWLEQPAVAERIMEF
jgi:pimeloyl-ACP methyl ester carboxylesterase